MNLSIQRRLVGSYLLVTCITVLILEIFLMVVVNYYYQHNVERILMNQGELSASFFQQYFADEDLAEQSERLLRGFAQNSGAQVQIISTSGELLQDSTGLPSSISMVSSQDVRDASQGIVGHWKGRDPVTEEPILAVSYPLVAQDNTVGIVRFATSLTETNRTVNQIMILLMVIGIIVIAMVALLSLFLSRTITKSVKDLKRAADRMTEGDFTARAHIRYRDELGSLAKTLNMMASKVVQNEKLKNDFISSVSHELRTPLTSIKGWVITLKSNGRGSNPLLHEGLDIIESESDRLTEMVDELLDFAKLDNGRLTLHRIPVQVSELLHQIGKQLAPRAERQKIAFEIEVHERLPGITADLNRLKQVMINLIDNALKFTEPYGRIRVEAEPAPGGILIRVQDTGAGIGEEELSNVFNKFYKVDQHASGSGLGLSISEQIVKLHHGEITMTSQLGEGTTVQIFLPSEVS
ncbi:sensor histidine kinase [Paenibacillus guangzhouensis]|uniref:sensor histidine kinase n=1 Tax=Paenibacillus guangzhouensis TaxID=1473112 RepID=UPI001D0F5DC9|nr:HAMP domain-containing sensor histidine kinase [Paenibacillus guangzhouensis]